MLTRSLKLWVRATVLISCLFMLSASFYAWGSTDEILIPISGTIIYGAPISNATLRFKSGFESPIYLIHDPSGQNSRLSGADGSGFNWDNLDHFINYVEVGSYPDHIVTDLVTTRSKTGSRSLYQKVIDSYAPTGKTARHNIIVYLDDGAGGWSGRGLVNCLPYMSKYYCSYWLYFPATWDMQVGGWNMLFENREWSTPNFSNALYIYRDSVHLYWAVRGILFTSPQTDLYNAVNHDVEVPRGRWFYLEIYVERHETNGIFRIWVDGVQIFNLNVTTSMGTSQNLICLAKLYGGFGIYPVEAWIDDLEIWDCA